MPLSAEMYRTLRETLLRCGPFDSNGQLRPLFIDSRLSPWRNGLPGGNSAAGRVDAVIEYLIDQENAAGDSALVLLLHVLAERQPGTSCGRDLLALADALQRKGPAEERAPGGQSAAERFVRQRLQDVEENIESDLALLRAYEEELRVATDPRERLRIEREIARQKEVLGGYRQEVDDLRAASGSNVVDTGGGAYVAGSVNTGGGDFVGRDQIVHVHGGGEEAFGRVDDKLDALSQQLSQMEQTLLGEHASTRRATAEQTRAILAHIDARHEATVAAVVARLDEQQLETVELLLDAAERQEVVRWEGEQLLLLVQQAVADLERLRRGQPDAAQWEGLLAALQQETGWQQKLKLTIPIVPGVLEFESEAAVEVLEPLRAAWQRLREKVGGRE